MDENTKEIIDRKSKSMMSHAMYIKIKGVVDSWENEEIGKAKVVKGAFYGLGALFVALVLAAIYFPSAFGWVLLFGLVSWVALYLILMLKHLGDK